MNEESSPSGKLIVGHDGAITTITLNRPKVHNAPVRKSRQNSTPPSKRLPSIVTAGC
jgi:hypothetical protein